MFSYGFINFPYGVPGNVWYLIVSIPVRCLPLYFTSLMSISECGPLDQPCNGHVDFETAIGGVATYSCELGYELEGESSRVCLDSGEWDGIAPCCIKTCRRKLS